MQIVINAIATAALFLACLAGYVILSRTLLPAAVLRVHHSVREMPGRGLQKYKFPKGRAILYEPHPSFRKYVRQYLLLVNEGYKYLVCRTDPGVNELRYSVVMFDRRDRLIDVIDVREKTRGNSETRPLLLHGDTSYVALLLEAVNDRYLPKARYFYRTPLQYILYFFLFSALTMLAGVLLATLAEEFLRLVSVKCPDLEQFGAYAVAAVAAGLLAVLFTILRGRKKGIGITRHGRR